MSLDKRTDGPPTCAPTLSSPPQMVGADRVGARHYFLHTIRMQCAECGYSPLDVRSYQCQGSDGHTWGHTAFEAKAFMSAKARSNLMCKACAQDTLNFVGCTVSPPRSSVGQVMWQNGSHQGQSTYSNSLRSSRPVAQEYSALFVQSMKQRVWPHEV